MAESFQPNGWCWRPFACKPKNRKKDLLLRHKRNGECHPQHWMNWSLHFSSYKSPLSSPFLYLEHWPQIKTSCVNSILQRSVLYLSDVAILDFTVWFEHVPETNGSSTVDSLTDWCKLKFNCPFPPLGNMCNVRPLYGKICWIQIWNNTLNKFANKAPASSKFLKINLKSDRAKTKSNLNWITNTIYFKKVTAQSDNSTCIRQQ